MDRNEVAFQTAELGKVDQGGGGTIAYILANYGMRVIDSGVAVLNMHAPWRSSARWICMRHIAAILHFKGTGMKQQLLDTVRTDRRKRKYSSERADEPPHDLSWAVRRMCW